MKIDQHHFPASSVNMVELGGGRIKVLTSQSAREFGSIDPKVHTTADEVKDDGHRAHQDNRGWRTSSKGDVTDVTEQVQASTREEPEA
jgi:hypothetical protein